VHDEGIIDAREGYGAAKLGLQDLLLGREGVMADPGDPGGVELFENLANAKVVRKRVRLSAAA
jgi:hypothetical protein